MSNTNSTSNWIAFGAVIIAIISAGVSIKSCMITNEQASRYYEEIKFIGKFDGKKYLIIKQEAGTKYILDEVELIPTFSGSHDSPFLKGTPYVLDLRQSYKEDKSAYFVDDIKKRICTVQNINNCENLPIMKLKMTYTINKVKKSEEIPFLVTNKSGK